MCCQPKAKEKHGTTALTGAEQDAKNNQLDTQPTEQSKSNYPTSYLNINFDYIDCVIIINFQSNSYYCTNPTLKSISLIAEVKRISCR